ncbi:hypothetical protein G6F37_008834 [Rhizopus arrhizus]|nr:hypothetical protein G6F38_011050 [Rhizopus arrhizus]KAG1155115.1 hypothetical protein G6F37_008834 [Rhizopus arrhizus]
MNNTIQNRFSSEMHFLNIQQPQQFIEDNTFYNHLIPSERQVMIEQNINYQQNPSESFRTPFNYTSHRSSLSNDKQTPTDMMTASRRYTEGSLSKYGSNKKKTSTDDQQRRQFLERNRIAALKCRQRKKQWLADLQHRVEFLTNDNEQLQTQAILLREELISLKTLLLAHKDCKVAQSNGINLNAIQNISSLQ